MSIKTISLAILVEDEVSSASSMEYALALAVRERAHLSCSVVAPLLNLPSERLLPLGHALIDRVNAERLTRAERTRHKLETACRIVSVPLSCEVMHKRYVDARDALIKTVRASDLIVMPRSTGLLSSEEGLGEGVLFESGRPVICIPPTWIAEPKFDRLVIAWDGSMKAARAVGDAMGFIEQAKEVQIVSVTNGGAKNIDGANLAEHLSRHSASVRLFEFSQDDAGWTLRDHMAVAKPDLLVMGAFAHSRLLQLVLGGVTSLMLSEADIPVFFAY